MNELLNKYPTEVLAMPVIITKQLTLQNAVQLLRQQDEEFSNEIDYIYDLFMNDINEEGYACQYATAGSKYGKLIISCPDQERSSVWIGFDPKEFYKG